MNSDGIFQLASHVHACQADGQLILLDLRRDRYLGIGAHESNLLREIVVNWPRATVEAHASEVDEKVSDKRRELLDQMLREELLLPDIDASASRRSTIERPTSALISGYVDDPIRIRFTDVLWFLIACAKARALLRWRSLEQIMNRVRDSELSSKRNSYDLERARHRVSIFNRLRVLFYTEQNACLFSSLAVREYLARDRLAPQLVFGVTGSPFRAHCWLQQGDVVINDTPEYVREYTPIMVL